jgi:hypothetical protein
VGRGIVVSMKWYHCRNIPKGMVTSAIVCFSLVRNIRGIPLVPTNLLIIGLVPSLAPSNHNCLAFSACPLLGNTIYYGSFQGVIDSYLHGRENEWISSEFLLGFSVVSHWKYSFAFGERRRRRTVHLRSNTNNTIVITHI